MSRANQEVEMVGEQGPGQDVESCHLTDAVETANEIFAVGITAEYGLAVDPADHHMVQCASQVEARSPGHGRSVHGAGERINTFRK